MTLRESYTPLAHSGEPTSTDSFVYNLARLLGSPFSYDVLGFEHIQTPGPAIYLANHLGALGPIETILSVPIRFYPWIVAEMMDFKRAPRYLYDDFISPSLHLSGRFGMVFSTFLSQIAVRLLRALGSISVDRFGGFTKEGFRQSLNLLEEGKNVLIFPEDAVQELDPETLTRPFMPGFAMLCDLFQKTNGIFLPVYPVAVHAGSETVSIGTPEHYYARGQHRESINDFCLLLEDRVRGLYLDLKQKEDNSLE